MSKFFADSMLGKLSRFLRFLGYDTLYRSEESIDEMLEISSKEKRIVLTHAKEIISRCNKENIDSFYTPTTNITDQLKSLKLHLEITLLIPPKTMRCSNCNGELIKKKRNEVIDKIPEKTAKYYEDFWECKVCSQIFWMGSHWNDIKRIIEIANKSEKNEN